MTANRVYHRAVQVALLPYDSSRERLVLVAVILARSIARACAPRPYSSCVRQLEAAALREVRLGDARGEALGYSWAPPAFRRTGEIRDGHVVVPHKGFAPVPRTLLDGTLPPPLEFGVHGDWICKQDWDFLVYAYSNGRGYSYADQKAMKLRCGIGSYDYYLIGEEQVHAIKEGLWERLVRAGLALPTDRFAYPFPVYDLLIPQLSARGRDRVAVRATIANMEAEGESFVRIPATVFIDFVWKQVRTHELRRVLAAMYVFNDLARFGGIDPEELRLECDMIRMSDAFVRACGQDDTERIACCLDYLSSRCGLANWMPVTLSVASTVPGERRLAYKADDDESSMFVMRPTLQTVEDWDDWCARQGEGR